MSDIRIVESESGDTHYIAHCVCFTNACCAEFIAEVKDKENVEAEGALVNMVLDTNNFPLAKCPRCGAVEVFQ